MRVSLSDAVWRLVRFRQIEGAREFVARAKARDPLRGGALSSEARARFEEATGEVPEVFIPMPAEWSDKQLQKAAEAFIEGSGAAAKAMSGLSNSFKRVADSMREAFSTSVMEAFKAKLDEQLRAPCDPLPIDPEDVPIEERLRAVADLNVPARPFLRRRGRLW